MTKIEDRIKAAKKAWATRRRSKAGKKKTKPILKLVPTVED
jgi:hypothetical protein